jgi:anti-sigma factor ChrR (cupin superfamily)
MFIHADFSQPVIIKPEDYHWVKSPGGEVDRMMFDRIGDEKARATSLVKYAPESAFPEHQHPLGEEVLILSGIFTENAEDDYPAGWYLRNPHHSTHRVSSKVGCLIFVKLMQMTEHEIEPTRINTNDPANWKLTEHQMICPLFQSEHEQTYLEKLKPDQIFVEKSKQGIELLIIKGQLFCGTEIYPAGSWVRFPINSAAKFQAGPSGTTLYVKTGHLQHAIDVWVK